MKPIPAPAIIDGVEWTVRDSGDKFRAYVDFESKTMVVPLDCGDVGDLIRNHEMAHVAITPRDGKRLQALSREFPNRTLQAAEDARVWLALDRAGIATDVAHWPADSVAQCAAMAIDPKMKEECLRALAATKGTGTFDQLAAKMPVDMVETVNRLYAESFGPDLSAGRLPDFEKTVEFARAIHAAATAEESGDSGDSGDESDGKKDATDSAGKSGKAGSGDSEDETRSSDGEDDQADEDEDEYGDEEEEAPKERPGGSKEITRPFVPGDVRNEEEAPKVTADELTDGEKEAMSEALGDRMAGYVSHNYDNGYPPEKDAVQILTPRLTVQHKGKGFGDKKVSADTGTVPRRLNRYATDQAVFGRKIRKGFATVAIDISGSMHLSEDEIREMIRALPHCTVAVYSGRGNGGEIVIVAKDGKMVEHIPASLGGNVVDIPALEWLAKQRGPRYWICDGLLTGRDDRMLGAASAMRAVNICRRANIKRFGSVEALQKGLAEKKAHSLR